MPAQRRNLILILTDQHRTDAIGCYGSEVCRSPNIDRLASEGVTFDKAYTTCSLCSPARASIMTGQFPHTHGMLTNVEVRGAAMKELQLRPDLVSEILKGAGYNLGYVGKWHLGEKVVPRDFGFEGDNFPGHGGGGFNYPEYAEYLKRRGLSYEIRKLPRVPFYGHQAGVFEGPIEATVPHFLAENTNTLLQRFSSDWKKHGKPFFIWCNFWGPHPPYYAPEEFVAMYRDANIPPWKNFKDSLEGKPAIQREIIPVGRRHQPWSFWRERIVYYYAFATLIDHQIGRILDHLKELGLEEDTEVIFSADHGESLGIHGGLADKTCFMYEENYRIPLIVKAPALASRRGTRDSHFVSLADIMPTLLEAAGITPPETVQGRGLLPLLEETPPTRWREHVTAEFHRFTRLYPQRMIRYDHYKYVYNADGLDEFYDLDSDPYELDNGISNPDYSPVIEQMQVRLFNWMTETKDVLASKLRCRWV